MEYENLISSFYELSCEDKKKEIYEELNKIKSIIDTISNFSKSPSSNKMMEYNEKNIDSEDDNLTKVYNNIMIIEEGLICYLKDNGY